MPLPIHLLNLSPDALCLLLCVLSEKPENSNE